MANQADMGNTIIDHTRVGSLPSDEAASIEISLYHIVGGRWTYWAHPEERDRGKGALAILSLHK